MLLWRRDSQLVLAFDRVWSQFWLCSWKGVLFLAWLEAEAAAKRPATHAQGRPRSKLSSPRWEQHEEDKPCPSSRAPWLCNPKAWRGHELTGPLFWLRSLMQFRWGTARIADFSDLEETRSGFLNPFEDRGRHFLSFFPLSKVLQFNFLDCIGYSFRGYHPCQKNQRLLGWGCFSFFSFLVNIKSRHS